MVLLREVKQIRDGNATYFSLIAANLLGNPVLDPAAAGS
jgi:hypothetical protein